MTLLIRRALARLTGSWERRADLSRGQTYDAARAELGGAPWREAPKSTDAWYILDEEAAAMPAPAESRRTRVAVVGVAVGLSAALLFFLTRSHTHEAAPLPAAMGSAAAVAPSAAAAVAPPSAIPAPAAVLPSAPAPVRNLAHARAAHHGGAKLIGKKHAHR